MSLNDMDSRDGPLEPIAIVGSACRFPGGVSSSSELWDLLRQPRDVLSEISQSRFNANKFYHPDMNHSGTINVRHSYFLTQDPHSFDAPFFGIKPLEADAVDPQQRLLLETTYNALEDAGIPLPKIKGSRTGVFIGLMTEDYSNIIGRDLQNVPQYFASGTARSIISNRVSYVFDLRGPSMTIDTACSSSLVALHLAVQSLRSGESDCALVGGSNLLLSPEQYIAGTKLKLFSPSGRSRMWDKDADGYGRGEGVAVLVLKRVSQALSDCDSIECLVRETGVNQDGKTKGITMPSAEAQIDLIKTTYLRSGLDLSRPSERPQYFEAHGTGTPAGDPIEAEAINKAIFGQANHQHSGSQPLYVGSIKTVLGHAESAAGVAGVMKASLALQHGVLPPNMLLNELSQTVKPFYSNLQILQEAQSWPPVSSGPRRSEITLVSPFNFSAASDKSLRANLIAYADFVRDTSSISLRDLSWTLNVRRSTLLARTSIAALTTDELEKKLRKAAALETPFNSHTHPGVSGSILAIFTGQGAQWATMGLQIYKSSVLVQNCFQKLQASLDSLPPHHAPGWKLCEELFKDRESSRLGDAAISQPLCTAVQVALVDLFMAAKVKFTAVVGHSSGEIAAAYAAGYLTAESAIRIAYYRGFFLDMNSVSGQMLAVGTSHQDARELCELPSLHGKITIAAYNSASSVTLSGDSDAIRDAKEILEDEEKFARILQVNQAYHSPRIKQYADPYEKALEAAQISVQQPPRNRPVWISTVITEPADRIGLDSLAHSYWADNMVKPVRFLQATEYATGVYGPFDAVVEVGPHPVLQRPTTDILQEITGQDVPYISTLVRNQHDTLSLAECLGSLWEIIGDSAVDFAAFESSVHGTFAAQPKVLKNLPPYTWDHDRQYWHETRYTKAFLTSGDVPHPLLGTICPDGTMQEIKFRNYSSPQQQPWLSHHKIQGQVVFPAAAYISSALEAIAQLYPEEKELVELADIHIGKAIMFPDNGTSIETALSLKILEDNPERLDAEFIFHSEAVEKRSNQMVENARGRIRVIRNGPVKSLPVPNPDQDIGGFVDVDPERFYDWASEKGYGYEGAFRSLKHTRRKLNQAVGSIAFPPDARKDGFAIAHPGVLDCALQAVLLAYSYPGDGRLRSVYLPTKIDLIRVTMAGWLAESHQPDSSFAFAASADSYHGGEFVGDVDIQASYDNGIIFQLQGLHGVALDPPSPENDVNLFIETSWGPETLQSSPTHWSGPVCSSYRDLALLLERVAYFYLRKLAALFPPKSRNGLPWNYLRLLDYADSCLESVDGGEHRHTTNTDLEILRAVGEGLPKALRGELNLLETITNNGLLRKYYQDALGMREYLGEICRVMHHVSHRFANLNILEIGAGTGAATTSVLAAVGHAIGSYTFTDISSGFFPEARAQFASHQPKMMFKTLDIEKPVADQGFTEMAYDVVVASLVLHATRNLLATMSNARRLLRPGGYLIILEVTDNTPLRLGLIFGGMPGWWLGDADDRKLSPCVSIPAWGDLMRKSGFSSIHTIASHSKDLPVPLSVMVTQAVDDRVKLLIEPLNPTIKSYGFGCVVIVGEHTASRTLAETAVKHYNTIDLIPSLHGIGTANVPLSSTVVCMVDLGAVSIFQDLKGRDLSALQTIFNRSKIVIWVTAGAQETNPNKAMFIGLQRTLALELPHVRMQIINFEREADIDTQVIATKLLQLEAYGLWESMNLPTDFLWHIEPELTVRDSQVMVPRMRLAKARNARYNAARRQLTKAAAAKSTLGISIIDRAVNGKGILIVSPPRYLGDVLATIAAARGIDLGLVTTDRAIGNIGSPWVFIHPLDTKRSIKRVLPPAIGIFLDMGKNTEIGATIRACLPTDCQQIYLPGLSEAFTRWMAEHGARHIAISSRNPVIERSWVKSMATLGCNVRLFDGRSVQNVYHRITGSMPPIAGVVQGAMVLRDAVFPELTINHWQEVTKPKIEGSIHLDQIFDDPSLDFFVFISSVAYLAGNAGQGVYSAANAFMTSLAAQRRSRGLAASVIHLGAVVGVGYITRELTPEKQRALHQAGYSFLSEQDFHEIFAEGVLASLPDSGDVFEISTGLRLENTVKDSPAKWARNPMFHHLVTRSDKHTGLDGIINKLQAVLGFDEEKLILELSPDELAIDSLVALDIQSWFRAELDVDIPILGLLNAPSIREIILAAQNLSLETTASLIAEPSGMDQELGDLSAPSGPPTSVSSSNTATTPPSPTMTPKTDNQSQHLQDTPEVFDTSLEGKSSQLKNGGIMFERTVPLSFAQSRFWFLQSFAEDPSAFNITSVLRLQGRIDIERLRNAVQVVGQRHEALRTAFYTDKVTKDHMQGILPIMVPHLETATVQTERQLEEIVQEFERHVYDVSKGETLRITLLSLSEAVHRLIFGYHHIILDGIGFQIFFLELEKAFSGTLNTASSDVLQYPDYSLRQIQQYRNGSWSQEIDYWKQQFATIPEPLPLLFISHRHTRLVTPSFRTHSITTRLDEVLQSQVIQTCRHFKVKQFHFFTAVFAVVLARYANTFPEDLCIGVADGNRKDLDTTRSLGLFLNLLPLRFRQTPDVTFAKALLNAQKIIENAYTNSRVPFDVLLGELDIRRSVTHTPLFQTFLNYRQNIRETTTFCGCEVKGELVSGGRNAYDVSLDIVDSNDRGSLITLTVNADLYDKHGAAAVQNSYLNLLQAFAHNPAARVCWPPLHTEEDVKLGISQGHGAEVDSRWPPTVVDRIDEMIKAHANKVALTDGAGESLTYADMARKVHSIATELAARGVQKGSRVGIFQIPGTAWVCSLLAVLRTGAVGVPLDLNVGIGRLSLLLQDCIPQVILVDGSTFGQSGFVSNSKALILEVSTLPNLQHPRATIVPNQAKAHDDAIITYTSGSTGVPKGVVIRHHSYQNFLEFTLPRWGITEGKLTVLQQSAYAFDISILQIFASLCYGGTLVIPDLAKRRDPRALCDLVASQGITMTFATPTEYLSWAKHGTQQLRDSQWRCAMTGGEPLTNSLLGVFKSLTKADLQLINCYGPTEASIGCADKVVDFHKSLDSNLEMSVLPNYRLVVVDDDFQPVPAGIPGQILIGGAGVAAGYLNPPDEGAKAFIVDQRATEFQKSRRWVTLHSSGDRGRLNPNGGLVLHGRIGGSTQTKLRGIRIDLADIENTIIEAMSPDVVQAVVSRREDSETGGEFLVAFLLLSGDNAGPAPDDYVVNLPDELSLPLYMRPSMALIVDQLPTMVSGKIDRAAVDLIPIKASSAYTPTIEATTLNTTEQILLSLWREVIPNEITWHRRIRSDSDFFRAGGNSLAVVDLQGLIKERLHITVPIYRLFESATLGQMAMLLDRGTAASRESQNKPVDWGHETQLSADIAELAAGRPIDHADGSLAFPSTVVLTGSTGFLGQELLRQLIADTRVTRIHCIAVRQTKERLPSLFTNTKVSLHFGDLGDRQLGLREGSTREIFSTADVVLHVGADVSFLKSYPSLRLVNVASTKELVRFCAPRNISLHFVSSATVGRLVGQSIFRPGSVRQYPPSQEADGYTASKWVSEVYLENASNDFGLPVWIHRPSSITGSGASKTDLMSNLLQYAQQINAMPYLGAKGGYFDFVSVETTARMIIEEMSRSIRKQESKVQYLHESGEIEIATNDAESILGRQNGEPFRVVSISEWIQLATAAGMDPLLALYLERSATGGGVLFPRLLGTV
ncbi:hypothetical protein CHGG_05286 [Chaetomium globosum CBS 148.51]|uniref:Carrier domain-containing protein n=1 Tax=Chaetomium globosum (strain ATCC 6205 / CBS 148.51 / DSM 1962 / NBRC 6347 / NRRL 1970) TaxID=306901 RepID=Q2H7S9_CHAGB|nr:uncharacterized protein CHGG_05286 [Chaetomium globosum CBS 148.51]EAQ88667.1 hypothetical protein CHGG_05286 [Chaetomium globosum CBS 148.51]